ncbi:VOC family protein [Cytobacillus purgationiresistens]|uniref:3-demethylubiquinone-9 3-methyltransferase (Glyoxalase superfamily) n=1 Tax=Cytobacillus purgationiresistens TaxID=863449 RepID=A0ABU0AUT0_9BACI|nr:VOC family protein [Cytobacillus purgationiresistens]MDQ0273755.1 putative 3-demethylubiquinone-9 3-methyltransferase (glyoxalase superfamily) [Cytobacillus purgationiresistens]
MATVYLKLLFNKRAEEAAKFYTDLFEVGRIIKVTRYPKDRNECVVCGINPADAGVVMNVDFEIGSTLFTAINGKEGSKYDHSSSLSLLVYCKNHDEWKLLYEQLSCDGKIISTTIEDSERCQYVMIQDKFGVFWRLLISRTKQTQKVQPFLLFSEERSNGIVEVFRHYTQIFHASNRLTNNMIPSIKEEMNFSLENQSIVCGEVQVAPNFSEALSFIIICDSQAEVDYYWNKLNEGGDGYYRGESAWLVDKYGIWWQVITKELTDMMRETEHLEHSIKELEENDLINVKEIKERRQ